MELRLLLPKLYLLSELHCQDFLKLQWKLPLFIYTQLIANENISYLQPLTSLQPCPTPQGKAFLSSTV